ncbi:Cyclin-dependent kinases regulatory subunit 2, partial [Mucuna pruriens]
MGKIIYSKKYFDDTHEYRHVVLPPELAQMLQLLTQTEWWRIGIQQSSGWDHYAIHRSEPHIILFRRPLSQENQTHQSMLRKIENLRVENN